MDKPNAVLDCFLESVLQDLPLEQAKRLVDFQPDGATQAHIEELARKCDDGAMSEAERTQYEGFVEAGDIIALIQAKAREVLNAAED